MSQLNAHPSRQNLALVHIVDLKVANVIAVCLGQNVARLELLHAVATFFRECPDARIAESATPESMATVDFFVIKPSGGRFEITMAKACT